MTKDKLCELLGLPTEVPSGKLVEARLQRIDLLKEQLSDPELPRPVKHKSLRQLDALESGEMVELLSQLEHASRIEALVAEAETELSRSGANPAVIELCEQKLKPLVAAVNDEVARFEFEKALLDISEKRSKLGGGDKVVLERIDTFLGQLRAEKAKPCPSHRIESALVQELEKLFLQLKDASARSARELDLFSILNPPTKHWISIEALDASGTVGKPLEHRVVSKPPGAHFFFEGSIPEGLSFSPVGLVSGIPVRSGTFSVGVIARLQQTEAKGILRLSIESPVTGRELPDKTLLQSSKAATGTLLRLIPKRTEGTLRFPSPPIHLVARPRFILGRQRSKADFHTWFLPETPANEAKTNTISRLNTTLYLKGIQTWVQDGGEVLENGQVKPSTGTVIDGQRITTGVHLNFTKERRLRLGESGYELKALHLPAVAPDGPMSASMTGTVSGLPTVKLTPRALGCIRFLPASSPEALVYAIWMFSEATLGSDPQSAVILEGRGLPPVAARFHYWEGGFWLEVPTGAKSFVSLDGRPLAAGDVRALQTSHEFKLGDLNYELSVS
jgi:hypothetical protein